MRVSSGSGVVREETVSQPEWVYDDAVRFADGVGDDFEVAVAQNSARYGAGPFRSLLVDMT